MWLEAIVVGFLTLFWCYHRKAPFQRGPALCLGSVDETGRHVQLATEAQFKETHFVLARAFREDPVTNWAFNYKADLVRNNLAPVMESYGALIPLQTYVCFENDSKESGKDTGIRSVAAWVAPNPPEPSLITLLFTFLPKLFVLSGYSFTTLRKFYYLFDSMEKNEKKHMADCDGKYLHLMVLGADISCQGKGYGSTVIRPMLKYADEQELPIYLESSNPQNVPFYKRHGFETVDTVQDPFPLLTLMRREPNSN